MLVEHGLHSSMADNQPRQVGAHLFAKFGAEEDVAAQIVDARLNPIQGQCGHISGQIRRRTRRSATTQLENRNARHLG